MKYINNQALVYEILPSFWFQSSSIGRQLPAQLSSHPELWISHCWMKNVSLCLYLQRTTMRYLSKKESKKMRRYNVFLRKDSGLPGGLIVLTAAKSYQRQLRTASFIHQFYVLMNNTCIWHSRIPQSEKHLKVYLIRVQIFSKFNISGWWFQFCSHAF